MNILRNKILSFFSLVVVFLVLKILYAQSANCSDRAFFFNGNLCSWSTIVEMSDLLFLSSGKGVIIALIDSGVDTFNPMFSSALWQNDTEILYNDGIDNDDNGYTDDISGWNFGDNNNILTDQNGHGTNVAGIVLQCAPEAKLMVLKINQGDSNTFYTDAVVEALYYAVNSGADLINMSLSLLNENSEVKDAINYAIDKGVMVVVAAGNSSSEIAFPGKMEQVITVGATTADATALSWSSPAGAAIDITAPGKSVETVGLGGDTAFVTGTSFSAPMVSGAIAALLGMNSSLKPSTVEDIIFGGAKDMGDYGKDEQFGWGLLSGSGVKQLAMPAIYAATKDDQLEISCYLPPTDSYTHIYIALVKNQQADADISGESDIDISRIESIWWLDGDGLWKPHSEAGVISIASLRLDTNGMAVLLFSDSGGIWKGFSHDGFESGNYNIGIAVTGDSELLAPVFWSPAIFF